MTRLLLILLTANVLWGQGTGPFLGTTQFGLRRGSAEHELLGISPFVAASASYDDGLGGPAVGSDGRLANLSAGMFFVTAGVSGSHAWKKDTLGIVYSTGYYNSFNFKQASPLSENASLGWTHEFSPRTVASITGSLSLGSQAFGMPGTLGLGGLPYLTDGYSDPNSNYIPRNELTDGRLFSSAISGDLNHNLSRNWAVSAGATGFTMLRKASNLIDSYGVSARGQVSRRVGRRGSIGLNYAYSSYSYAKGIGDMTSHALQISYHRQIGRQVSLSLSGGAVRVERIGVQTFTVDPLLQAILGVQTGTQIIYGINYYGTGTASISRSFRRHSLSLNGNVGTSPGNGFYAGSRNLDGAFSYAYSGFNRWGVAASVGYTRYVSLMQIVKPYQGMYFSAGLSRNLFSDFSLSLHGGTRHINSGNNDYIRNFAFASLSLSYAPGAFRIPAWW